MHLQWISCKESKTPSSEFDLIFVSSHLQCPSTRKVTGDGIIILDIKHQEEVMLILYYLIVASDNPMQAEECSHSGLRCNYFCCTCKVGGTMAEKKTDKGYSNIFQVHGLTLHRTILIPPLSPASCTPWKILVPKSNNKSNCPNSLVERIRSTRLLADLAFVTLCQQ